MEYEAKELDEFLELKRILLKRMVFDDGRKTREVLSLKM